MTDSAAEALREQFIEAYRRLLLGEGMNIQERRFEWLEGGFSHRETAVAWWAWQASRQAVAVELPLFLWPYYNVWKPIDRAYREAIEAQGLKVVD